MYELEIDDFANAVILLNVTFIIKLFCLTFMDSV